MCYFEVVQTLPYDSGDVLGALAKIYQMHGDCWSCLQCLLIALRVISLMELRRWPEVCLSPG